MAKTEPRRGGTEQENRGADVKPYFETDNATIYHGDNIATMQAVIPDASIDLVVTSPPYDNLRTYGGHSWDFEGLAAELWRAIKPGGVVVWVVADATVDGSETGTSFRQALHLKEIGFRLHDTMIWNKGGFSDVGSTQTRYGPVVEFMFVLSSGKPSTFNALKDRRNAVPLRKISGTVKDANGVARPVSNIGKALGEFGIRFNDWAIPPDRNSAHPAPFPEALARDHILSWSNEGDTVLDPFSGSGTTAKMARLMGRKAIGIEVNREYCDIAVERLRQRVLF
jgi:site-specific DNA-methyltransferase (adenine-specific)